MPAEADGFRFGVAPRVLGQEIVGVTKGRVDEGTGQNTSMSTQTKTCEKDQENRLHTVRRGAGVSANAVSIWAGTASLGIT